MSAALGLPDPTLLLDDGTGTFPYDISAYGQLEKGLTWQRGRGDEHSANQAGTFGLTLDNTDGRFTLGSTSGGYGTISNDRLVRLKLAFPGAGDLNKVPAAAADFETGIGAWVASGTTLPTVAQDATRAWSGTKSLKITWAGAGSFPQAQCALSGFTIGQTYTVSAWVYAPTGSPDVRVGGGSTSSALTPLKDQWVMLSATFVAASTTPTIFVRSSGTPAATSTWVDGVMVNVGTVAGTFNTLSQTVTTRFTGAVQDWPTSWPTGGDTLCDVTLAAVDALASLARQTLTAASDMESAAAAVAGGYYPLQESAAFSTVYDTSGTAQPALTWLTTATWLPPTLAVSMGTPDGSTGAQWIGDGSRSVASMKASTPGTFTSSSLALTCVFLASGPGFSILPSDFLWFSGGSLKMGVSTSVLHTIGTVTPSYSANLVDGKPHSVTLNVDATTADLWVDGVKVATAAGSAGPYTNLGTGVRIGADSEVYSSGQTLQVSRVSFGPKVADAEVAQLHSALLHDCDGETPAQRITRLFTYVTGGYTTGTLDTAGDTILGLADQAGKSALDVVNDTLDADLGDAYVDANGHLSTVAGASIVGTITPAATIDANWLGEDTVVTCDMFGVVNVVVGTGTEPAARPFTVTDPVSINGDGTTAHPPHGKYPAAYTWNVNNDAQALARSQWIVGNYSQPKPRLPQVVVDLLTMDPTTVASLLALDLTSLLSVTGMPAQTPGGSTITAIVEGMAERISSSPTGDAEWSLTLTLSMKALRSAWVLGDATYGVLSSTTKLYV